ncbi:MAG: sugar kinase [Verrucomicrobiota bacterium]
MSESHFSFRTGAAFDVASMGAVMFRLSSEQVPLVAANSVQLFHGGAAYNFVYALKRTFGYSTAFLSALPDDLPGRALYRRMLQSGADLRWVKHLPPNPSGPRLGINWTDSGFGNRPPTSHADRAGEAIGFMNSKDFELEEIFAQQGCRWFHADGITPGISDSTPALVHDMMQCAKKNGSIVSYDLNYRHALWGVRGGPEAAGRVNRSNLEYADVLFAGVGNLLTALGLTLDIDPDRLVTFEESAELLKVVASELPHLRVIAATWRNEVRANCHELGALLWMDGEIYTVEPREFEVLDRVGSGDAFDAGVVAGLMAGEHPQAALAKGRALSAHSLSTAGDVVRAIEGDLEAFLIEDRVRISR